MSSKNRKVYEMGDRSIREFFSSPTRYLAEALSIESEFEKPYLDEDRGRMHNDPSWPDWPPMPDIPPWPPLPPFDGPVPGLPGCMITCYPPHNDCDNPVWCHPSIWCGADIGCTLCRWEVEGATKGFTPHNSGVGSWGIDIWIDDTLVEEGGEALITACMTDPCGNVCCEDIEVTCKICPPEVAISWDSDNSAETIGRSESVSVFVKDGLGDYSWEVAGTGFSMLHPTTSGVENTLVSDGTACGSATITVTDFCGDSTTGYVRCTAASQWVDKQLDTCVLSGPASYVAGAYAFEYITGNKRQKETIVRDGGISPNLNCADDADRCDFWGCSGNTCLTSPFLEPGAYGNVTPICQDHPTLPGTISCFCGEVNMDYQEWECT